MPNQITVDVRLLKDAKPVVGLAEVSIETELGELTISRAKIIHQDGKHPWVSLPDNSYKDKQTGEWKHSEILTLSARLRKAVAEAVLVKYAELSGELL